MKKFLRTVSALLAVLMVLGSVSVFAVYNDGFKRTLDSEVRFYRFDGNDWVETTKVARGEQIEARIILRTDFIVGAHTLYYLYDANTFEIDTSRQTDNTLISYDTDERNGFIYWDEDNEALTNDMINEGYLPNNITVDNDDPKDFGSVYVYSIGGKSSYFDGVEEIYSVYFKVRDDAPDDAVGTMFIPPETRRVMRTTDPNFTSLYTYASRAVVETELGKDVGAFDGNNPQDWEVDFEIYNVPSANINTVAAAQGDDAATIAANTVVTYNTDKTENSSYVTVADLVTVNYFAPAAMYDPNDEAGAPVWQIANGYTQGNGARAKYYWPIPDSVEVATLKGCVPDAPTSNGLLQDIPDGYYFAGWAPYDGATEYFVIPDNYADFMTTVPVIADTVEGIGYSYPQDGLTAAQGGNNVTQYDCLVGDPSTAAVKPLTDDLFGDYIYEDSGDLYLDLVAVILPIPVDTVTVTWKYWEAGTTTEAYAATMTDVVPGTAVTPATVTDVPGYSFAWYNNASRTDPATTTDYTISADKTFFGKYTAIEYVLSWFIGNVEIKSDNVTVEDTIADYEPVATDIDAVTPAGKYFDGTWSSDINVNMPAVDTTIQGAWSDEEYIFQLEDGTTLATVTSADTYSELPAPADIPEGHSFAGYQDAADDTVVYDSVNSGDTAFGDLGKNGDIITVKPVFTPNQYVITYYDSDNTTVLATATDIFGATITEPAATVTDVEGYTFAGTWTYKTEAGTVCDPKPATYPAENLNAYPDFNINTYKYIFVDERFNTAVNPIEEEYDTDISFPVISKSGYEFDGWFVDSGLTEKYLDGAYPSKMPALGDGSNNQSMTLYAGWKEADTTYTITVYTMNTDGQTYTAASPTEVGGTTGDELSRNDLVEKSISSVPTGFHVSENSASTFVIPAENGNYDLYLDRNTHIYTLVLDGGTLTDPDPSGEYVYGATVATVSDPVKANYNFKGWDAALITEMPDEDVTITAQWKHYTEITVIMNNEDPSDCIVEDVEQGEAITPSDAVPVEGYTFVGWATDTDADPDSAAVSKTITAGDEDEITYYPIYKINTHTVTFIPDAYNNWDGAVDDTLQWPDGIFVDENGNYVVEVPFGTELDDVAPTGLTRTGYSFDSWQYDENPMPDEDIEAIAIWNPNTHDIIYVWIDNDGVEHEMTGDSWYGVDFGDDVYDIYAEPGEREGWTFTDTWLEETDGLEPGDYEYMPDRNLKFIAQYEKNEYDYEIDLDGGEVADGVEYTESDTYEYETAIVLPADDKVSKPGFDFDGWVYMNTDTDEVASPVDAIPAYNLSVTAQWDRHTYNIEYVMNGGTPDIPATTAQFEDTINLPVEGTDFTKTGSDFSGWKCSVDGAVYDDTFDVPALDNNGDTIVFTAQWDISDVTITFDSKGGSDVDPKTGPYNTTVEAPDDPEKAGYDFAGWYEDEGYNTSFAFPNNYPATDIILFAKWTPHKYNVVFLQPDDGATEPVFNDKVAFEYKEVYYGDGTEAPDEYPELQYYEPQGWATSTDGEPVDFSTWTMPAADKTSDFYFYPVFERSTLELKIKSDSDADIVKTSDSLPVNGYIYNAGEKLNITKLQAQLEVEGDGSIRITQSKGNSICGTGTKVELIDNVTGDVVEAYYLIVAGDVNGDSACNANDYSIAESYRTDAAPDWGLKDKDGATDEQIAENARIRECYVRAADVADANGMVDDVDTALIELVILKSSEFSYDKTEHCITVEDKA